MAVGCSLIASEYSSQACSNLWSGVIGVIGLGGGGQSRFRQGRRNSRGVHRHADHIQ